MGQAKKRGGKDERVRQARAAIEAMRPEVATCGSCKSEVRDLELFESRNLLPGLKAIFGAPCGQCGCAVWAFIGDSAAVQQAAALMHMARDEMNVEDMAAALQRLEGR